MRTNPKRWAPQLSKLRPHTWGANSSQSSTDGGAYLTGAPGPKGGLHTCSVLGMGVITCPLVSQSGGEGAPVPASHSIIIHKWKLPDPVPAQKLGTPLRPRVNPARPVGPGPVSQSQAARSATPRPRCCRAGKRAEAQGSGARSLPAGSKAPHQLSPSHWPILERLFTCDCSDSSPGRPAHVTPPLPFSLTHAQYLPLVATLPLPAFTLVSPGRPAPLHHALI